MWDNKFFIHDGYNLGQYRLRQQLKSDKTTLPNQLRKQVGNPTLRWIFQIMEGISLVHFYDGSSLFRAVITNINAVQKKIIYLFRETTVKIYGLIPKNCPKTFGMYVKT